MNPTLRKIIIPIVVSLAAVGIVALIISNPGKSPANNAPSTTDGAEDSSTSAGGPSAGDSSTTSGGESESTSEPPESEDTGDVAVEPQDFADSALRAVAPTGGFGDSSVPLTVGSLDWRVAKLQITFSSNGAGISRIILSDIWNFAAAKREADRVKRQIEEGVPGVTLADLPGKERYIVQQPRPFMAPDSKTGEMRDFTIPAFVARAIFVNGVEVSLFGDVWSQTEATGSSTTFETAIQDESGSEVLRITRRYSIQPGAYDIALEQSVKNLTAAPLTIRWLQYGQADLDVDRARYMDRRRYRAAHLPNPAVYPDRDLVQADTDFSWERASVTKMAQKNQQAIDAAARRAIWPNEESIENNFDLTWFAAENRYFAVAVYPPFTGDSITDYSIENVIQTISPFYDSSADVVAFELYSPRHSIAGGEALSLNLGIYAGPLNRHTLGGEEPYKSLRMNQLILYQMSSFCAICTFQWLAHLLEHVLYFGHMLLGDWGIAIILLVVLVRTLLHPITKKSQISIQRFSRAMQKLKPEIEKLQQKYGNEPKRMQQEQMRLWKEHNISPFSMLGCLPMFLQTPIWIALYAMLYFAYDLRQEPAFWGIFQFIGDWAFLGDLSAGDHFFGELAQPVKILMWNVTGINLLPLLMGVVFYVSQKYMTPPTTATMSPEQQQMQKMMKIIFPIMFPIMLYSAPSGLTLYILTSSIWGILESRYIRAHIDQMELDKSLEPKKSTRKKKSRDPQGRAYQSMMERMREKQRQKQNPSRRFKKRK